MRTLSKALLTTSALALAAPATAMAQETDLTCTAEVEQFIETVRSDAGFPEYEPILNEFEPTLTGAIGEVEADCFAVLAQVQNAFVARGAVIADATDEEALARTREMAIAMSTDVEATRIAVQAVPAQVAVASAEAQVTVEQEATEVDVAQRAAEIEVRQPQATIGVQAPQQTVDVVQPEAQVAVAGEAPQVEVTQPAPRVEVQQAQPEINVQQTEPQVTIEQPEPEIVVRQFQPEVEIRQPQPTITVEQPEPEVTVIQPEPIVTVEAAQPEVEVAQAQPNVTVEQATPEIEVTQRQPEVEVIQPEARVMVEEQEPIVNVEQGEPVVDVTQAAPQVDVAQAEATVEVTQDQATVDVTQAEATVTAELAEGADVTAMREEGGPDVAILTEDRPTIVMSEVEMAAIAKVDAVLVAEVEFAFDSAEILEEERTDVLMDVADKALGEPNAVILLTGYASPIGDAEYNLQLSERRVSAVESALVEMGISAEAIRSRSLGEDNPEVTEGNVETERSEENRRVEIRLVDGSAIEG